MGGYVLVWNINVKVPLFVAGRNRSTPEQHFNMSCIHSFSHNSFSSFIGFGISYLQGILVSMWGWIWTILYMGPKYWHFKTSWNQINLNIHLLLNIPMQEREYDFLCYWTTRKVMLHFTLQVNFLSAQLDHLAVKPTETQCWLVSHGHWLYMTALQTERESIRDAGSGMLLNSQGEMQGYLVTTSCWHWTNGLS